MNTASRKKQSLPLNKAKKKSKLGVKSSKSDGISSKSESFTKRKIRIINEALDSDPVDIELLRKLMISNEGCVTNDLRCKVWPKLLNVNIFEYPKKRKADIELKEFQANKWWHQVNLDINRCHRRFPQGTRVSRRRVLQHQLTSVIMRVLCRKPELNYYQGYHDIAVTLLRVVGEDLATALLDQLSDTHIRDFMDVNMNRTNKMLGFFHPIMNKVERKLEFFLDQSDVGSIFCLSWLITWFGHDINGFDVIVRLFDLFLASHPIMPVYVAVAIVHRHMDQVLKCECDMAMVHHFLSKLPLYIGIDDVEEIVSDACQIFETHPPDSLEKAVQQYIKGSTSIAQHRELIYQSYAQRPDNILRKRKRRARLSSDPGFTVTVKTPNGTVAKVGDMNNESVNPIVKVAVWTMTVSMGVMTFFVLNTSKYWL